MTAILRKTLILAIRGYQLALSPLFGNCCRFEPSCSHYWIDAIARHGCLRGVWLGIIRISKCHPLSQGGPDPVPEHFGPVPGAEQEA